MLTSMFSMKKDSDNSVMEILTKIKNGDQELRNQFIDRYKSFIFKHVSKSSNNKFINIENSEEFSIGLIAFNEAIDCYNHAKNSNFFNFAKQVIKRRLINYQVSNQKYRKEYPSDYFENEYSEDFLNKNGQETTICLSINFELKEEILLFQKALQAFGINIKDLISCSPKHKDSKMLSIGIAKVISSNEELFSQMMIRKGLPINELLRILKVSKRTLERHRKFIIAICLILRSELEIMKEYLNQTEKVVK